MTAKIFLKYFTGNEARKKLSQSVCFSVHFDDKFDNNNNSFQWKLEILKKICKIKRYLGKIGYRKVEAEFP